MFLWARLVLEYLGTNIFFAREEILSAADSLPKRLSDLSVSLRLQKGNSLRSLTGRLMDCSYGQILAQLTAHFDERSSARAKLILGCIAYSKRPLRKAEFRSALAFSAGDPDASELPPPFIFEGFSALVEERVIQRSHSFTCQ